MAVNKKAVNKKAAAIAGLSTFGVVSGLTTLVLLIVFTSLTVEIVVIGFSILLLSVIVIGLVGAALALMYFTIYDKIDRRSHKHG